MFLNGSAHGLIKANAYKKVFLLERGSDATRARRASYRRRSGGRGSHPSTVRGLNALLLNALLRNAVGRNSVALGGRELVRAAGKGQRARSSEGLGLRSVGGVSLNGLHLGQMSKPSDSMKIFFLLARTDLKKQKMLDQNLTEEKRQVAKLERWAANYVAMRFPRFPSTSRLLKKQTEKSRARYWVQQVVRAHSRSSLLSDHGECEAGFIAATGGDTEKGSSHDGKRRHTRIGR